MKTVSYKRNNNIDCILQIKKKKGIEKYRLKRRVREFFDILCTSYILSSDTLTSFNCTVERDSVQHLQWYKQYKDVAQNDLEISRYPGYFQPNRVHDRTSVIDF